MTRKRERAFAGFGAALFLITSSFFTIFIIYTLLTQNKSNDSPTNNSSTKTSTTQTPTQYKLEGTKLSDFAPIASIPSLQTADTKAGNGATVTPNENVTVNYTGAVAATGTIFQSSLDSGKPVSLSLNGVIAGWSKGIPGMKVGGTRRLLIPSAMAYGAKPPQGSNIPPNADLVFDVTVISASK